MGRTLFSTLFDVPENRIFLKSANNTFLYKEVKDNVSAFEEKYPFLKGKRCAVISDSRLRLAFFLPALENLCSSLFLQPSDIPDDILNDYLELASIDYTIHIFEKEIKIEKLDSRPDLSTTQFEWLLTTSGTSGMPKMVSYSLDRLMSSTKIDISRGKEYIWALCYDLNRFAGLQVYLQAISSGSTLSVPEEGVDIKQCLETFVNHGVNAVSATPTFWRRLLMYPTSDNFSFKHVTLGGEMVSQATLDALSFKYPNARITHIYASTEAGVGFSVKDKKEGFPISYLDEKSEMTNKLKVRENRLWIKNQRANNRLLKGDLYYDEEGYLDTGDVVILTKDRVIFKGRESGSINVGGNKVMPEEVENVLNSYPLVEMSHVYGKRNPVMGMLVTADLVLVEQDEVVDKNDLKKKIKAFCQEKLEAYKVPAFINFVHSIELNKSGKIKRTVNE